MISVFDNYRQTIEIDEIYYDLELADTAGQVDYEQVRLVSNSNLEFAYFSVVKPENLRIIK